MAKDWINISTTPPRYRFKLVSPDGTIILKNSPIEWKDSKLVMERRINSGGIFTNYSVDTLTFIKEGFNFIRDLFNSYELNAKCDLYVYEFNFETRLYEQFPSTFALNFSYYKLVRVGNTKIQAGVQIKAVNSSELTKFDNRKGIDVDLTKRVFNNSEELVPVSIGGFQIVDWSNLKKNINFQKIKLYDRALVQKPDYFNLPRKPGALSYICVEFDLHYSDFSEVKATTYSTQNTSLSTVDSFFENALFEYDFRIGYKFQINITDKDSYNVWTLYLYMTNADGSVIHETHNLGTCGTSKGDFIFSGYFDTTIQPGWYMKMVVEVKDRADIKATIRNSQIRISQSIAYTNERVAESLPLYEALERNLQLMLDKQFPMYSEYLGRTDVVYNGDGDMYSSENQERFVNVMSGLNIRGGLLTDPDIPVTSNFEDLFHGANCIYNLGYGPENFENGARIRIENYSFFFNDTIVLDISDRIDILDIESEVLPEYAYADIQSGYNKFEYEEINGRGEFNTTNKRTSIINTNTKYDNISKVRADSKGIINLLGSNLSSDSGTTDEKGDNELFFMKVQRNGDDWDAESNENITIEEESSIFGDDTFNLFLSPTRNLIRHGNKLKASLIKYVSSYLRFQTSEKLQTLKTTGEGYTVTENDDLLVDDLADPIYKPISHTVQVKLTFDERKNLMTNPTQRIKFTSSLSGWLLKYTHKNNEDKVELTIIEKYVS